jgi:hypothetical protein
MGAWRHGHSQLRSAATRAPAARCIRRRQQSAGAGGRPDPGRAGPAPAAADPPALVLLLQAGAQQEEGPMEALTRALVKKFSEKLGVRCQPAPRARGSPRPRPTRPPAPRDALRALRLLAAHRAGARLPGGGGARGARVHGACRRRAPAGPVRAGGAPARRADWRAAQVRRAGSGALQAVHRGRAAALLRALRAVPAPGQVGGRWAAGRARSA